MWKMISETLRMYPPIPATFRVSRNAYKIPDTSIVLPEGTMFTIPIYSVQRDPNYFPNPEKFDPDRFEDESPIGEVKGTYLPFGDGPRSCIGNYNNIFIFINIIVPCSHLQRYPIITSYFMTNIDYQFFFMFYKF